MSRVQLKVPAGGWVDDTRLQPASGWLCVVEDCLQGPQIAMRELGLKTPERG
jgi:hypothetical protein